MAKVLLTTVNPWMLAALMYLGSGLGLSAYRLIRRSPRVHLSRKDAFWFAASILAGGIIAPVLFLFGLQGAVAANAALLLNAESVFTTLLAWWVFHESLTHSHPHVPDMHHLHRHSLFGISAVQLAE